MRSLQLRPFALLFAFAIVWIAVAVPKPAFAAHNSGAAICIEPTGLRLGLGMVAEPDSGAIVVWLDTRDQSYALYAQRLDRHGKALWAPGGLLVRSRGPNDIVTNAVVLSDGAGGCLFSWEEQKGATGHDIVVQRILPNGTLGYGVAGLVVCNAAGDQINPVVVAGPAGSYYVVWSDGRATPPGVADVYAQRLTFAGAAQWAANGVRVNSAPYTRSTGGNQDVVPDLQGGLITMWSPSATSILRAQRLSSAGVLLWGVDGVEFGPVAGDPRNLAPDGSGGAFLAYLSNGVQIYLVHLNSLGTHVLGGSTGIDLQLDGALSDWPVRDGAGGCFVYSGGYSAQARRVHVSAAGTLPAGGPETLVFGNCDVRLTDLGDAVALTETPILSGDMIITLQRFAYDGTAQYPGTGVIVGRLSPLLYAIPSPTTGLPGGPTFLPFADSRYGIGYAYDPQFQLFGQAVGAGGVPLWTDSEVPTLASIGDVAPDQGGFVRVNWNAGTTDVVGAGSARRQSVWRSVPSSLTTQLATRHPLTQQGRFELDGHHWLAYETAYWEQVGEQSAALLGDYAMTVPTAQDSTPGSSANESFMVEVEDDSTHFWFSTPLSAHSVDNLAPPPIPSASGVYSAGHTTLYWSGVVAQDLCCYDVFRGSTPGFAPSDANRVGSTGDQTFLDTFGPSYYRIAAKDIHGNLGPSALVTPTGVADVASAAPHDWALRAQWSASRGSLLLTLDLPQADEGRIEVFDVLGRRLWDAPYKSDAARSLRMEMPREGLRSGLVYARARIAGGRTLVARAVVLR